MRRFVCLSVCLSARLSSHVDVRVRKGRPVCVLYSGISTYDDVAGQQGKNIAMKPTNLFKNLFLIPVAN